MQNHYSERDNTQQASLNLFVPNTPFLYPLKRSENRKVF